ARTLDPRIQQSNSTGRPEAVSEVSKPLAQSGRRHCIAGDRAARAFEAQDPGPKRVQFTKTTDIWANRAQRVYMALTMHYLDASFRMRSWVLKVEYIPGVHTATASRWRLRRRWSGGTFVWKTVPCCSETGLRMLYPPQRDSVWLPLAV
ncbi:hypothetical protein PybrP1_004982, partial [[Pythium] brassicae (nom. inval.)]